MNKAFDTGFTRFGKSRLIIVLCVAVAVVLVTATVILASGTGTAASETEFTDNYEEYLLYEKSLYESVLSDPAVTGKERHDAEMNVARIEYYLDTRTTRTDYYNEASSDGGAYWMQIYFLFGAATSAIAAIALSVFFFPGTRSGIHKTEFLAGSPRSSLWTGKNGAAALTSLAVPAVFGVVTLISALCAPDARFLVEDDLTVRVYSISVFTQWALQVAATCTLALVSAAIASLTTSISGDSTVGITVPLVVLLVCTLGMFIAFNIFKENAPDNFSSTFIPYVGIMILPFRYGATSAFVIALAAHIAVAAACYSASYFVYGRKPL